MPRYSMSFTSGAPLHREVLIIAACWHDEMKAWQGRNLACRRRTQWIDVRYDYTQPGAYFVTFCAAKGQECFGRIHDQTLVLNPLGQIAYDCWRVIPEHHPHVQLDEFVIMPNHGHGIIEIVERPDGVLPDQPRKFGESIKGSVSTIVNTYKAAVTRIARKQGLFPPDARLWHGRFWDHIIRDEVELARIRDYIVSNPARWLEDQLHPKAPPSRFNRWK